MAIKLLVIALGGALGSAFRFLVSSLCAKFLGKSFPWGTFIVNFVGCILIGFFAALFLEKAAENSLLRFFVIVGFLGGFTTFSSFSLETIELIRNGFYSSAAINVGGSILAGLAGTIIGISLLRL